MSKIGLSLAGFLDAVSWGDSDCTSDSQIRAARTSLMNSPRLPGILHRWWKPPRSSASHKSRSVAARPVMEEFAHRCLRETIDDELEKAAELFKSSDDASEAFFVQISFCRLSDDLQAAAPTLWSLLRRSAYTEKQEKRNTHKNPSKIILMVIAMLCYSRSHHANNLQKMFAIYLKFRGLSAKAFDTLHALAITMSHKWAADHVVRMSEAAMKEVMGAMESYPWLILYDNINIPFRVFSQRLHNKDNFSSGAAATVYIKRHAEVLKADSSLELQQRHAWGMKNPLTPLEIFDLGQSAAPRIQKQMAYEVLRFLLEAPEFNIKSYQHRDSSLLLPPEPVHALPYGEEHITLQYMLGSVNIPEVSYADNERLVDEWLSQLGINNPAQQQQLRNKVIAWVGDQLTVDCLRVSGHDLRKGAHARIHTATEERVGFHGH